MANIKLFNGMDFSGKSTLIKFIDYAMPNVFKLQKKFITPIDTLQKMIERNIWVPRDIFIPLLQKMVEEDISTYQVGAPILQDTLWIIKFSARLLAENSKNYLKEIDKLLHLIEKYPKMDSFYITTTTEERLKRYKMREISGERISASDKLLFSIEYFEETEKYYKDIIFNRFPNTQLIDTTFDSPELITKQLIKNQIFLSGLYEER